MNRSITTHIVMFPEAIIHLRLEYISMLIEFYVIQSAKKICSPYSLLWDKKDTNFVACFF